ncbi:hypothetical protein G3N57_04270 [Paraburkholderia sp. Se-20369]|nr:hypothetical protein [Paraburkholderia sp. Se-20369]
MIQLFSALSLIVVGVAIWLLAHRLEHDTVRYAIGVIRKLLAVFVVAPALVFFLWVGVGAGFNAYEVAKQASGPTVASDVPTIKDEQGRVLMSPPRSAEEGRQRLSRGIASTYWIGVLIGALYVLAFWAVVERPSAPSDGRRNV